MNATHKMMLKADWADKHIRNLGDALRAFHQKQPNFVASELNPKTGEKRFYVGTVPTIPPEISLIAGDVVTNLWSTFDHLAYHLVAATSPNGIPAKPKQIYFPVAGSSDEYMSAELRRKKQKFGAEAIKRIDALEPYKGGKGLVWEINELNNLTKHRMLIAVAMRYRSRSSTPDDMARMRFRMPKGDPGILSLVRQTNFGGPTEPLKVGDPIFTKPAHLDQKMEFKFEVALNEPEIIEFKPLFETLYVMFKFVEGVIPRFADLL